MDALGHSPRRMARAPPPPVPPKRFQVKDALKDLPVPLSSSPDGKKQSAVERLAADKAKYIKSQPGAITMSQPIKALPVIRKQLAPPCSPSSGQSRPSSRKPMRKVAPTLGPQSGGPQLDLKHLTNLISGVGETPSPPSSQTADPAPAISSSSQSSEGGGGDENCPEPPTPPASTPFVPDDKLPLASSAPSTPTGQLSPASSVLSNPLKVGSDAPGSQGPSAVAVRRVDVRPQVAQGRKGMRIPLQRPMHMQRPIPPHAPLQSQAHLMYLLKAQMASKNASLFPKNGPLVPPARLPLNTTQTVAGVTAVPAQRMATNSNQPPQQTSNGRPLSMAATAPVPPHAVSATPQNASSIPPVPLQHSTSPTGKLAGPSTTITPVPPLPSPLTALRQGGSSSPAPCPSPSPSITRLSSTSSRKRPSLTRSKSDVSDRFSRAGADLERFFNYCGLDPADLEELTQAGSDIASVSRFRSASAPASECSQPQEDEEEEDEEEKPQVQRTPYGISVIERNARVIKWLYGLRQERNPA